MMARRLKRWYTDPALPGSFQGVDKIYHGTQAEGLDVNRRDIEDTLRKEESYTINRKIVRKFPRNRVIVSGFDALWESDLADLTLIAKANDGYKYVLVIIDVFSRYMWMRPLKTKHAKEIVRAFKSVLAEGRQPRSLRTDSGSEFRNGVVVTYLKNEGIHHYTTHNETQANYAERVIKTIKSKIYRYLIKNNTQRHIDVLEALGESYNKTKHRMLGRPPIEVNKENESEVRLDQHLLRKPKEIPKQKFKWKVDDKVRLTYRREAFDREYDQRWSGEVFVITERRMRRGIPVYKLKDWDGEPIKGTFYQQELQKVDVTDGDLFKIEKILKRRRRGNKNQVFVKWLHWPKKFSSWIDEDQING